MVCKPSIGDSKSGTRDGASGTTGYGKPGTGVSLAPVTLQIATQEMNLMHKNYLALLIVRRATDFTRGSPFYREN